MSCSTALAQCFSDEMNQNEEDNRETTKIEKNDPWMARNFESIESNYFELRRKTETSSVFNANKL